MINTIYKVISNKICKSPLIFAIIIKVIEIGKGKNEKCRILIITHIHIDADMPI